MNIMFDQQDFINKRRRFVWLVRFGNSPHFYQPPGDPRWAIYYAFESVLRDSDPTVTMNTLAEDARVRKRSRVIG